MDRWIVKIYNKVITKYTLPSKNSTATRHYKNKTQQTIEKVC